jgi:iron-sulfur cluster repair protein YtfE (RIC family)
MQKPIEIASRFSRVAREAVAAARGQRGIFRTLKGEHAEVQMLMLRCARTHATGRSLDRRRQLFARIRRELLAHAQSEQVELYPVLARHELTHSRSDASLLQHREIEALLEELSILRCDSPEWIDRFDALDREVRIHVHEEENLLFPLAARALTPRRIREIDRRFRVEKRRRLRELAVELH